MLKIEAIKIGDSEPAPLLTKIVGPSEEARKLGKVKKEDISFIQMARENADIYVDLARKHKKGEFKGYDP